MIDNQQVKYKISILFFGSLIVCRSCLQPLQAGGAGPKTAARPGQFRGGGPSRISPSHHTPPHPSKIYMYLISVNNALLAIGGQPLDTRYYWSSSEHSSNSGWIVLFNNGRTFTRYKRLTTSVRFVRDIE